MASLLCLRNIMSYSLSVLFAIFLSILLFCDRFWLHRLKDCFYIIDYLKAQHYHHYRHCCHPVANTGISHSLYILYTAKNMLLLTMAFGGCPFSIAYSAALGTLQESDIRSLEQRHHPYIATCRMWHHRHYF